MDRLWATASEHRRTIIALSAVATLCGLISIARQLSDNRVPLRRRGAVRRRARTQFTVAAQDHADDQGRFRLTVQAADSLVFSLVIGEHALPDRATLEYTLSIDRDTADRLYGQMIDTAVHNYMRRLVHSSVLPSSGHVINNDGTFDERIDHGETLAHILGVEDVHLVQQRVTSYVDGYTDEDRPYSHTEEDPADAAADELKALLYHIAEDKSKREAFLHRGIRCEECGETPIRSVRWHCLHCPDYDLCNACKALTAHPRSHVFAEIQIPIPVLAQPVNKMPLWYSGNSNLIQSNLQPQQRRLLAHKHAFSEDEIDALFAQFSCLVDTTLEQDPSGLHAAMGYGSFLTSLTSAAWRPFMRSSIILERIFSFYDSEHTGSIDFDAFVSGIAYLRGGQRFNSLDRAIRGFDVDDDGFVSRADCVRLLQTKFEIHCRIIHEMAAGEESEHNPLADTIMLSSQPVSSAFQGDIPEGRDREPSGKTCDHNGDMIPNATAASRRLSNTFEAPLPDHEGHTRSLLSLDGNTLTQTESLALGLTEDYSGDMTSTISPDIALIWTLVSQALNESLDRIFKPAEDMLEKITSTAAQRSMLKNEIKAYRTRTREPRPRLHLDVDAVADSRDAVVRLSAEESQQIQSILTQNAARTDEASLTQMEHEIRGQSLAQLLDHSGYGVRHDQRSPEMPTSDSPRTASTDTSSSPVRGTLSRPTSHLRDYSQTLPTTDTPASSTADSCLPSLASETFDSPMTALPPRPSASESADLQSTQTSRDTSAPRTASAPAPQAGESSTRATEQDQDLSDELLPTLAEIEEAAQRIRVRGDHVCLRIEDIVSIVEKDSTGELQGLMRSWLEWASF